MLDIENRQAVVVHLLARMLRHYVLTVSDSVPNSNQNPLEHSRVTFRPKNCRKPLLWRGAISTGHHLCCSAAENPQEDRFDDHHFLFLGGVSFSFGSRAGAFLVVEPDEPVVPLASSTASPNVSFTSASNFL